jgi:hypothetical protein
MGERELGGDEQPKVGAGVGVGSEWAGAGEVADTEVVAGAGVVAARVTAGEVVGAEVLDGASGTRCWGAGCGGGGLLLVVEFGVIHLDDVDWLGLELEASCEVGRSATRGGYRCPFGPPGPALARARGGPLIFVLGRPGTIIYRAHAVLAHGLGRQPKPRPVVSFRAGLARSARALTG